jgi:phosphate/phosphite/phosphonate ABC transporter binding protein
MASPNVTRLVFGLVAASPGVAAEAPFEELAAWMRENAGIALERKASPTYKELAANVRSGASDVAWLPPVVYAWLAEGVTPVGSIMREGRTTYSAALVVRDDSTIRELADLRTKRAAWVDPWSAAGYVVPRIELARAGIDAASTFATETFHGTHRDALLALERGDCDVAGTFASARDDGEAAIEGAWSAIPALKVRVLATFEAIPPDVIAVRRNLAPADYERVLDAFRSACTDPTARPLVHAVFGGDELREGIEPGHDTLRRAYERAIASGLFD